MSNFKKLIGVAFLLTIMASLTLNNFAYAQLTVEVTRAGSYTPSLVTLINKINSLCPTYVRINITQAPTLAILSDNVSVINFCDFNTAYKPYAGMVINGDIYLNKAMVNTAAKYTAVVSHEIGHALGLGHDNSLSTNLMNSTLAIGNLNYTSATAKLKTKYASYVGTAWRGVILGGNGYDGPGKIPR